MIAFGGLLVAAGLVMALAVADSVDGLNLVMAGWIIAAVGVVMIAAGLATSYNARRSEHRVIEDKHVSTD
ncbi:MAG: DUF6458 family protein [Actinomycetes bacterium]